MNNLLECALGYAAIGWHVFPLAPGQKIPITPHGVKDATTETDKIEAWWSKWPNANIAVACGENSGIYVVDVDVTESGEINGLESLKEFPPLPITVRQDTPRGGFHAFFRTDIAPINRNSFRPGIDVRGNGYYVVLAPSIHPNGGRYSWSDNCEPGRCGLAEYPDFMRPVTRAPWGIPAEQFAARRKDVPEHGTDVLQRASLYLSECEPAVQGNAGHDKLLWAANAMVHGFILSESQAFDILAREYNPRCMPPWNLTQPQDEKDFRRKVTEAIRLPSKKPDGWLLNDSLYSPIDTSGINVQELLHQTQKQQIIIPTEQISELKYLTQPTGLLGEICSWINSTAIKEQPFLSLACSLAFLGALFGRKVKDSLGSRTNLYCMGIAPSSAGKAHAMNQVRRLCASAGATDLLGGDDIASDSSIEDRMSRVESTLFLWDEIGHLLAHIKSGVSKHHAQVVSLLMKLYSAAGNIYKGKEYAEKEKQRTIIQPCCCIYGTSTPERFAGGISPSELQDGWLSRCLIFCSPTSPVKRRGIHEQDVPGHLVDSVREWYLRRNNPEINGNSLGPFVTSAGSRPAPIQIVVPTEHVADLRFTEFDNATIKFGKENPQLACLWAKGEENARRIALIVAAGENFGNPIITDSIAHYSCKLIEHLLIDFGSIILPELVDSVVENNKRKLVKAIESFGVNGATQREVTLSSRWTDQRGRGSLLNDLRESCEIVCCNDKTGKTLRFWTPGNYIKYIE